MVVLKNKTLAKKIRHITTTSKIKHKWEYIHDEVGYNFRMPNINAALGLAQLKKINSFLKAKRKLFQMYYKELKYIKGVSMLKEPKNCRSNYCANFNFRRRKSKFKNLILKIYVIMQLL